MSVQGPLTRSLRDARLALRAMAQGDPLDTRWVDVPLAGPALPRPLGVALVPYNPGGSIHPAQAEAVHRAGQHLAVAGYAVDEIAPPDLEAIIETWHRIGSTDVLPLLAPQMAEHGDPDAQTSMRLWRELIPPTDLRGVLGALAQRDLFLWRWLEFMQRYPLVVMPTFGELALPHNLDTTREGQARVLDAIPRSPCRSATMAACVRVCRYWRRASARICVSMPAKLSKRQRVWSRRSIRCRHPPSDQRCAVGWNETDSRGRSPSSSSGRYSKCIVS